MVIERRRFAQSLVVLSGLGLAAEHLLAPMVAVASPPRADEATALSGPDYSLLESLVDTIIPETDTPGAAEAGVAGYINTLYGSLFSRELRQTFDAGLTKVHASSNSAYGKDYINCTSSERVSVLSGLAVANDGAAQEPARLRQSPSFFLLLKELTIVGYYTSKIGATQELLYQAVHGVYRPCLSLGEERRAWYSESLFKI